MPAAMLAVVVVLGVAGALALHFGGSPHGGATIPTPKAPPPIPTLYCEFYNFMHNATVVSFLFAVDPAKNADLQFHEMAVVEPDGTRTEYDVGERPLWSRATIDGTASIASPDGATRIMLYGFAPDRSGIFWTEAGVRSDFYKNLEGKCRQANFGGPKEQPHA